MKPRERVMTALSHREPDRIPFDLGSTIVTSITREAYINLRNYLGFPGGEVKIFDHVQQLPYIDEGLLKRLGVDLRMVQTQYATGEDLVYSEEENYYYIYDRWGAKMRMPKENGHYFDWVEFPISEISMDALKRFTWPEPDSDEGIRKLEKRARDLYENTDYALAGTGVFGGGIFEQPARIMGMENFLLSLLSNEPFADAVMDRITELYIENCNRYLDALGEYIQVFVYWNDLSSQHASMISPDLYRRLIKPKDKRLIDAVRRKTDARIFYHSCGAIREFLPDLIEIGVDIINPVQVTSKGMDTRELKKEFGSELSFWGGGIDTQHVLPYGTVGEVRDEVKRRIDDLAPGGGFVFNTVHNIQNDVPPQNIMAMWETLKDYGVYLLIIFLIICSSCAERTADQLVLFDPALNIGGPVESNNNDEITLEQEHATIAFAPGNMYSTVFFYPENGPWDASDFRFVRAEIENMSDKQQLIELGFGDYDLTLGGTLADPGEKKVLKAIIYRSEHPAYIDSVFPVMHGKPDGTLRGWMASTYKDIESIKLLFPLAEQGDVIRVGQIRFEGEYLLLPEDKLREHFYPFVDRFGQFMYSDWRDKIHSKEDLKRYDEKENEDLSVHPGPENWNQYGGWEDGPQLEATGRFRVEKYEGKWWFVDPEGRLFWSHGLDCVEFGTQTQTRIDGCEHYFSWLPEDGSPEAGLYVMRDWRRKRYQMLSFHTVNIFRKYGASWREKSNDRIHRRMRSWGMNTIGNWSDSEIYLQDRTPYVLTAYSMKTGAVADPFARGFSAELEETLRSNARELDDPWCLGVFIDNELNWGVKWGPKIREQLLVAPADQPAKQVLAERLREKYGTVKQLNEAWGSDFSGWEAFLSNEKVYPGAVSDMRDFTKEITAEYFASCRKAVKNVAPDLLYLGCRMDFHLYPEDTSLNYIIKIASDYCDVVSFNRYRYSCSGLVPPGGGDYPVIIGEFHFGSLETGLLQPGLKYAADNNERAEFYDFYVTSALQNPYIIGTHWFQLADQAVTGRPDGENYQAGFLTVGDLPQQEIIDKSRQVGYNMYRVRYGIPE